MLIVYLWVYLVIYFFIGLGDCFFIYVFVYLIIYYLMQKEKKLPSNLFDQFFF